MNRRDFTGYQDLGRFIDICAELGLLFYARFGPFICDEWEGGGHPAWLIGKDAQFRAMHEPTLKYLRRWFDRLMPILVRRQITRRGPVILVQQENEYYFCNRPDGRDYQTTLVRWMRKSRPLKPLYEIQEQILIVGDAWLRFLVGNAFIG